jgi:hypothetical protein
MRPKNHAIAFADEVRTGSSLRPAPRWIRRRKPEDAASRLGAEDGLKRRLVMNESARS